MTKFKIWHILPLCILCASCDYGVPTDQLGESADVEYAEVPDQSEKFRIKINYLKFCDTSVETFPWWETPDYYVKVVEFTPDGAIEQGEFNLSSLHDYDCQTRYISDQIGSVFRYDNDYHGSIFLVFAERDGEYGSGKRKRFRVMIDRFDGPKERRDFEVGFGEYDDILAAFLWNASSQGITKWSSGDPVSLSVSRYDY